MDKLQEKIDSLKKTCLLAKEIQVESENLELTSKTGGIFFGEVNEEWPFFDSKPLVPVLSILTQELPYVPTNFDNLALINIYAWEDYAPIGEDDGSVVIKTYKSIDGLVPLRKPESINKPCFRIKWEKKNDFQDTSQLEESLTESEFQEYKTRIDELNKKFPNNYGIKIGGWPTLVQETYFLKFDEPEFVFQVDCNEVFMFCDSGIGYVFNSSKHGWTSHWETM